MGRLFSESASHGRSGFSDLADPLYSDSRVIATPHIAFVSAESLINLRERTAKQVVDVLQGRVPENVINPQVLPGR